MSSEADREAVAEIMGRIHQSALNPQAQGMRELLHSEFAIGSPGPEAPSGGRDEYIAGIVEFWSDAKCVKFSVHQRVHVAGDTGVGSSAAELVVERSGVRSRSTWRDVWVFTRQEGEWLAMWRTILDFEEQTDGASGEA